MQQLTTHLGWQHKIKLRNNQNIRKYIREC